MGNSMAAVYLPFALPDIVCGQATNAASFVHEFFVERPMSARDQFEVPAQSAVVTTQIKRSRFVTCIDHVPNRSAFDAMLAARRAALPDAGHHCWACLWGPPGDQRFADKSDDGEPRGTAGKPMLHALANSGLGEVGVVVTRFFGGIKLGAGGLARAYGGCVSEVLAQVKTRTRFITEHWTIHAPYSLIASIDHLLKDTDVVVTGRDFGQNVTLGLDVPLAQVESLGRRLDDLGQGAIERIAS